jgi:hypothetical protein
MGANGVEPKAQKLGINLKRVGVDAVCGGFCRTRLAGVAVLRGRRRGLSPMMQTLSSVMCCNGQGNFSFSLGTVSSGRGHGVLGCKRAGRGVCGVAHLVPCRFVYRARETGMCTSQNGSAALGIQSVHGHWQGAG